MGARTGAATRPCGKGRPGHQRRNRSAARVRASPCRAPPHGQRAPPTEGLARSDRREWASRRAPPRAPFGRLLKPHKSKMEGDIQVRFYRDCIYTSHILQADRRMVPPPATDSACKQDGSVGTDAVLPRLWPRFPHLATRRATLVGERPQGSERDGESGCRRADSPSRACLRQPPQKSITYRQMALNLAIIYRLSIDKVLK